MQHTDLPIPLWVFYDEMGALSAKYGEDIYGTKVAGDEDRCYLDVGDWGSAHSEPVLRALVGLIVAFFLELLAWSSKKFQTN
jgi:hypothetical protein